VKKPEINKFDGLIHEANGDILDPSDGHKIKYEDNDLMVGDSSLE